jgi:hypothetical protein
MFSSLDRADIAMKSPVDGTVEFVQTDHRSAKELEKDRELSTLFLLIRILHPKRMVEPGSPAPIVSCLFTERPPEFIREVVSSAGGRIILSQELTPDDDLPAPRPLDQLLMEAFRALAATVAEEFSTSLTIEGLGIVEKQISQEFEPLDENEIAYWSAIVKLGTFAGELIRQANGGHWIRVETGTLPLALATSFRGEPATVNPLGKAIKFFDNGPEDSLVSLVELVTSHP